MCAPVTGVRQVTRPHVCRDVNGLERPDHDMSGVAPMKLLQLKTQSENDKSRNSELSEVREMSDRWTERVKDERKKSITFNIRYRYK